MKKNKILVLAVILISGIFFSSSCKKKDNCVAGTGGSFTVVAKLAHHGVIIPNDSLRPDTVWVKFNTQEGFNPASGYDAIFIGEPGEDHVHVSGLRCGDYYFAASGWDTSGPFEVKGGGKFSTEQNEGEGQITISVTE